MSDSQQLDATVEALLADPAHAAHPLRRALADLYAEYQGRLHQIERITHISDRYQSMAREANLSLSERFGKQLRQLERMARISDRYQLMMRELNEALKEASTTDVLTGIGNRRMLTERLKSEVARAERVGRPLTIALIDLDHFKAVNDTYGHDAGDKVLVEIARTIETDMREYDSCGRWGGEEFLVIMPEITATEGALIIERLRDAIRSLQVPVGEQALKLTASFGIAEHRPGESIFQTISRADAALFNAKRTGRDHYEIAS